MAYALDVLIDNRPAVELLRHIVRRCADDLHAALVRLMVRLAPDERRQERVVNVNGTIRELLDELLWDDLHVACKHN